MIQYGWHCYVHCTTVAAFLRFRKPSWHLSRCYFYPAKKTFVCDNFFFLQTSPFTVSCLIFFLAKHKKVSHLKRFFSLKCLTSVIRKYFFSLVRPTVAFLLYTFFSQWPTTLMIPHRSQVYPLQLPKNRRRRTMAGVPCVSLTIMWLLDPPFQSTVAS